MIAERIVLIGSGVVLGLAVTALVLRRRLAIVMVTGSSMQPAFSPGDRVLVRRATLPRIRTGQVVVMEEPVTPGVWPAALGDRLLGGRAWMIKRVAAVPGEAVPVSIGVAAVLAEQTVPTGQLLVLGDNAAQSADSRVLGYIPADRLLGVVLSRLPGTGP
jgi:signal peptidase I